MELFAIKEHLSDYKIETYGNQNLGLDIHMMKFLTRKQNNFQNNIIYFGSTDMIPPPNTLGEFVILCYGDAPCWSSFQNSSFCILFLRNNLDYIEVFNKVQNVLQNNNNINMKKQMLFDALLADKGLQYLVDVAYEVFGNPLFVIDNSYKYLAISTGVVVNNPFVDEENQLGYISEQGIKFIRKSKIDEKIRNEKSPICFYNPLHDRSMMVQAITINNIEVGRVMLYELDQPFNKYDNILLHQTSRIIAVELQKNSFITSNKGFMYSYFFADLLDNPDINYNSIKERLSVLGYNLKDEQYILVIPSQSYHNAKANPNVIAEQLKLILHGSIYAIYKIQLLS